MVVCSKCCHIKQYMLTKMRLFVSCFAYITAVNDELVKTVLLVGEIHVMWIHYGDKLTQMVHKV
jgi:hypothetical protein